MIFLSYPKLLIVLVVGFFLFGVPLMGLLVTWKERRDVRARRGDRR